MHASTETRGDCQPTDPAIEFGLRVVESSNEGRLHDNSWYWQLILEAHASEYGYEKHIKNMTDRRGLHQLHVWATHDLLPLSHKLEWLNGQACPTVVLDSYKAINFYVPLVDTLADDCWSTWNATWNFWKPVIGITHLVLLHQDWKSKWFAIPVPVSSAPSRSVNFRGGENRNG